MTNELKTLCPNCFEIDCDCSRSGRPRLVPDPPPTRRAPRFVPTPTQAAPPMTGAAGRGPSGKLRNFRAMSDAKLVGTLADLKYENNDDEATWAATREAKLRGLIK